MIGLEFLWPSRIHGRQQLSTRPFTRTVRGWIASVDLEPSAYGTHSMRRTKVAQIFKKTGNLRAVQLLLGHTKMDSTVRFLGVDIEDALTLSERIDLQQALSTCAFSAGPPKAANRFCRETLLNNSADGRTSRSPGQTYPTTFVTGMPSAVKSFRTVTRTWNSVT